MGITNVLSFIPDIVEWICGSFFVYNPTLNRFFILHFILPFLVMCLLLFHPDNALEVNILITPFHIVPEWYFLSFYAKLKTIPDKNSGICILIITILLFFMSDSFGFV